MSESFAMRSLVGVPMDRMELVAEIPDLGADAVMLDLADLVADAHKDMARANLVSHLSADVAPGAFVRVGTLDDSARLDADLDAAIRPGLTGIILPETEEAEHIRELDERIGERERERDIAPGTVRILPLPETALAIHNIYAILTASDRVVASMLPSGQGADLANDVGFEASPDGSELIYMRSKVVVESRAAGIEHILDGAWLLLDDLESFERDTARSRRFGFTGRFTLNAAQTEAATRIYSPTPDQVAAAQSELDAWDRAIDDGVGMFTHRGKLVDIATVKHARKIVARAGRQTV